MPVSPLHAQVASIALGAAAAHGFALGGGNALLAYGIISRPTRDVDLFTDQENGVLAAAGTVEAALGDAGFAALRRDQSLQPQAAARLRPAAGSCLEGRDFADAGQRLDRLSDEVFAMIGLGRQAVAIIRQRFAAWPGTPGAADRALE